MSSRKVASFFPHSLPFIYLFWISNSQLSCTANNSIGHVTWHVTWEQWNNKPLFPISGMMLSHVISELIHCSPYVDDVFDMSRKLCSSHGSTKPCEPVDICGSLLGTFVLGMVWTYMVSSLEMFTELNDGLYCRSAFNQNEVVKGDYHMGRESILS